MAQKILEKNQYLPFTALVCALVLLSAWYFTSGRTSNISNAGTDDFEDMVLQKEIVLPIMWGSLGTQLVEEGVIDEKKIDAVPLLEDEDIKNNVMTPANSGRWLNLLWAFGLANKNPVLEQGPMVEYGDTGRFASTGGWNVAKGSAMDHYSIHQFVVLTAEQQKLVERVSQNIYRPCCGNSTYFPDCNHGMAMLGLLELMAANNVSEDEMYKVALKVNALWFPDTYLAIAQYLEFKGSSWEKANAKELLGYDFSSALGYQRILSEITPSSSRGGGSCGI